MSPQRLKQIGAGLLVRAASAPMALLNFQTRARAIERLSEEMVTTIQTPGGPLKFFCPTPLLASRAESLLTKEPDTIQWIDSFEKGAVLWDIGANIGVFTLYAALKAHATVVAFEPSAANFHVLARNIQLNSLSERVTAYCVALSGATELGVLNLSSAAMGSAMSQFGKPGEMSRYCNGHTNGTAHGMIGFAIDEFIARFRPPFPTHIKLDVDGLEWPILQGAKSTLSDPRLRSATIELNISNKPECARAIAFLETSGLKLKSQGEVQGTETQKAANHLFVRG